MTEVATCPEKLIVPRVDLRGKERGGTQVIVCRYRKGHERPTSGDLNRDMWAGHAHDGEHIPGLSLVAWNVDADGTVDRWLLFRYTTVVTDAVR